MIGTVVFQHFGGNGRIRPSDGGAHVLFHKSAMSEPGDFPSALGRLVHFDLIQAGDDLRAVRVRLVRSTVQPARKSAMKGNA